MLTGLSPFFNYKETNFDQRALYKRILQGKFDFPASPAVSPNAKDLIRKMLVVDPNERLGCLARADLDLRDHPWFASTNFCKLYKKEVSPPWVPAIKDPFDGCNFAKWDVEDKSGLKPLTAREQQHFADF